MTSQTAPTQLFDPGTWAPPVETVQDLWALAPEGQLCFVKSENTVFERRGDAWIPTRRERRLA